MIYRFLPTALLALLAFVAAGCSAFPKTRGNFEYTLNSYIGYNISAWEKGGNIDGVTPLPYGRRRYSLHSSDSPGCKWFFDASPDGTILKWEYQPGSSPCRSGASFAN